MSRLCGFLKVVFVYLINLANVSFKLDSRGNWWNDNSGFFMLLLLQSGTQHVVPTFFFNTVSFAVSIFFLRKTHQNTKQKRSKPTNFEASSSDSERQVI